MTLRKQSAYGAPRRDTLEETAWGSLTPAVQLVEGVDAALEVGEQCKRTGGLPDRALRRDRAQQRRDAPRFSLPVACALERRRAVFGVKVIEDLLRQKASLQPPARLDAVDVQHRRDVIVLQQDLLLRDAPVAPAQHQFVLGAPEERVALAGAREEHVADPGRG